MERAGRGVVRAPSGVAHLLLIATLLGVGGLSWRLQGSPDLAVDTSPLASLEARVAGWESLDVPVEPAVEAVLDADLNLQRAYLRRSSSDPIWLYVGYYGTHRGGRPSHTPRGCYTGAGWEIAESRTHWVDAGRGLRVNEYWLKRGGDELLVFFWYRSYRRTGMLGGFDQNVDRVLGRLFDRRADGALIRVSTPLRGLNAVAARTRLSSFAAAIDQQLAASWPIEHGDEG